MDVPEKLPRGGRISQLDQDLCGLQTRSLCIREARQHILEECEGLLSRWGEISLAHLRMNAGYVISTSECELARGANERLDRPPYLATVDDPPSAG